MSRMRPRFALHSLIALALVLLLAGCSLPKPGTLGEGLDPKKSSFMEPLSELDSESPEYVPGPSAADNPIIASESADLPRKEVDYTIMVYMVGTDLETDQGFATKDIKEMMGANVNPDRANVLVYTGGAHSWHANIPNDRNCVIDLANGSGRIVAATDRSLNMGDKDTLSSFVTWANENYPAKHTALILWDHGGGPADGYGFDQIYRYDSLTLEEMSQAMADAGYGKSRKLDWVGFDACLMGSIETVQCWRDYATYFVGSEDVEGGEGWDYSFLKTLETTTDTKTLTISAVEAFGTFYETTYSLFSQPNVTLSSIDLSKLEAIEKSLDGLSDVILSDFESGNYANVARARERCRGFGTSNGLPLIDLVDLADRLVEEHPEEAQAVRSAVEGAVVANTTNLTGANGLALYFPVRQLGDGVIPATADYGKMLDAYAEQGQSASTTDWTFPDFSSNGNVIEIGLNRNQTRSLVTATYTILANFEGRGYVPIASDITMETSESGTLQAPVDPRIVVSAVDGTSIVPIRQTDDSPEREVYQCSSAFLLPGSEFVDTPAGDEQASLQLVLEPDKTEVGIASATFGDGDLIDNRNDIDLRNYKTLMLYLGGWQYPERADDGTMLPYSMWDALSGNMLWYDVPITGELLFETKRISELEGTFVMQVVISDLNGTRHASELIPLQGKTDNTVKITTEAGRMTFLLSEDHAELTAYKGKDERLEVPAEVEGLPVTAVADDALHNDWNIRQLVLPDTITTIGTNALKCHNAETIELGSGVTTIGSGAMCGLINLKELTLPAGLKTIGRGALRRLSVSSLTLPASLETLGEGALAGCEKLEAFEVEDGCQAAKAVDGVLFSADGSVLVVFPAGRTGSYEAPSGTKTIGYGAFVSNKLESITLPEGLTTIENCAFYCSSIGETSMLQSITLPDSLESIGSLAFGSTYHDTGFADSPFIEELHLGKNLSYVGSSAFTGLRIGRFVVDEENATYSCPGGFLTNKAGDTILEAPAGMGQVVVVPDGITTIGKDVFELAEVGTDFILPTSLSRISVLAFRYHYDGMSGSADAGRIYDVIFHCDEGSAAAQFAAKYGITWDTNTNPDNLTATRTIVEQGSTQLTYLVYPDHAVLHSLDGKQDADQALVIDAEVDGVPVTKIDSLTQSSLSTIAWDSVTLPATLEEIDSDAIPYLKSKKGFVLDGKSETYSVIDGVLFSADGDTLLGFALADPNTSSDEVFSYDVPEGTKTIGYGAFTKSELERVSLPASLRVVRSRAFQWNYRLTDVQIAEGLERIEDRVFYCSATGITLPNSLTYIGDSAFLLDGYEGFRMPDKLKHLGSFVLYDGFESIPIGTDTLHIGRKLSYLGQKSLASADITSFEVDEGNKSFSSVDGLLLSKDGKTLLRCPAGKTGELRIPAGVEHVEPGCLDNVSGLTDIYFPDSVLGADAYHDFTDGSPALRVTFHCKSGSAAALFANEHDIPWTEEGV